VRGARAPPRAIPIYKCQLWRAATGKRQGAAANHLMKKLEARMKKRDTNYTNFHRLAGVLAAIARRRCLPLTLQPIFIIRVIREIRGFNRPHPACGHLPPCYGGREIYYFWDRLPRAGVPRRSGSVRLPWAGISRAYSPKHGVRGAPAPPAVIPIYNFQMSIGTSAWRPV